MIFVLIELFNEVDFVRVDSEIDKILIYTALTEEALGPYAAKTGDARQTFWTFQEQLNAFSAIAPRIWKLVRRWT